MCYIVIPVKRCHRTGIHEARSEKSQKDEIERKITSQLAITFSSAVTAALYWINWIEQQAAASFTKLIYDIFYDRLHDIAARALNNEQVSQLLDWLHYESDSEIQKRRRIVIVGAITRIYGVTNTR